MGQGYVGSSLVMALFLGYLDGRGELPKRNNKDAKGKVYIWIGGVTSGLGAPRKGPKRELGTGVWVTVQRMVGQHRLPLGKMVYASTQ